MFTGIIEELGTVERVGAGRITVRAQRVLEGTRLGDSIAVNGVCLTVTHLTGAGFTADVMPETLRRSSLGQLRPGSRVNLERAMAADGRRHAQRVQICLARGTGKGRKAAHLLPAYGHKAARSRHGGIFRNGLPAPPVGHSGLNGCGGGNVARAHGAHRKCLPHLSLLPHTTFARSSHPPKAEQKSWLRRAFPRPRWRQPFLSLPRGIPQSVHRAPAG